MNAAVNYWKPKGEGPRFELSPMLTPLAPFRDQLIVVSGLSHAPGRGDGRRQRRSLARQRRPG